MKKMLSLLLAMMMCLSLAACGDSGDGKTSEGDTADGDTPDKVYTLKMTYTISGDETVAKCAQEMAEKVEERTNGGLVLENYPNGELATDTDALELCAQGANVISFGTPDFLTAYVPDLEFWTAPSCFPIPVNLRKWTSPTGWRICVHSWKHRESKTLA